MECQDCSKATNMVFNKIPLDSIPGGCIFFRFKNANIVIVGCKKHVKEAISKLKEAYPMTYTDGEYNW